MCTYGLNQIALIVAEKYQLESVYLRIGLALQSTDKCKFSNLTVVCLCDFIKFCRQMQGGSILHENGHWMLGLIQVAVDEFLRHRHFILLCLGWTDLCRLLHRRMERLGCVLYMLSWMLCLMAWIM